MYEVPVSAIRGPVLNADDQGCSYDQITLSSITTNVQIWSFNAPVAPTTNAPAAPTPPGPVPCPCVCFKELAGPAVDCSNLNLTSVPAVDPSTVRFILDNNLIQSVQPSDFNYLKDLTYLSINSNLLTGISDQTFASNTKIKTLRLSNNQIASFSSNVFPVIQPTGFNLDLSANALVGSSNFNGQAFQTLDLSYNQIAAIGDNLFTNGARVIRELNLAFNQITMFPDFSTITPGTLNLTSNAITELTTTTNVNTNLQSLYVDSNKINTLDSNFLSFGFSRVENFIVNNNKISAVPDNFFVNQTYLQKIDLRKNNLVSLPEDGFKGCYALSYLDLGRNKLVDTDSYYAALKTESLRTLKIDLNKLSDLGPGPAPGPDGNGFAKSLTYIDFGYNRNLTGIDGTWLQNQTEVTEIVAESIGIKTVPNVFSNLPQLQTLILGQNENLGLYGPGLGGDFIVSNSLRELALDLCLLKDDQISLNAFNSLPALQTLILDANRLTVPKARYFQNLVNLKNLSWENNPWSCDCESIPFVWLLTDSRDINARRLLKNTVQCSNSSSYAGAYVEQVPIAYLSEVGDCVRPTPVIPNIPCPDVCTCYNGPNGNITTKEEN